MKAFKTLLALKEKYIDTPLSSPDLLPEPSRIEEEQSSEKSWNNLKLSIGGRLQSEVALINSSQKADHKNDPIGIFKWPEIDQPEKGEKDKQNDIKLPRFEPIIHYDDQFAWLRYSCNIHGNAKASSASPSVKTSVNLDGSATLSYYKRHEVSSNLASALITDIERFPKLWDDEVLESLDVGDAIVLSTHGKLNGAFTLSSAELFSGVIGAGGSKSLVTGSFKSGASIAVGYTVEDDFDLILSKMPSAERPYRVAVQKNHTQGFNLSGKFGIEAKIDINEAVYQIINGLIQLPQKKWITIKKRYQEAFNGVKIDESQLLSEEEIEILDQILELVYGTEVDQLVKKTNQMISSGIHSPFQLVEQKLQLYFKWLEDLQSKINAFQHNTLQLAVSYEYSRISTDEELLEFNCSENACRQYLPNLINLNIEPVLEDFRSIEKKREPLSSIQPMEIQLVRYFRLQSVTSTSKWGLVFGFNKYAVSFDRTKEIKWVKLESIDPAHGYQLKKVSFNGSKFYSFDPNLFWDNELEGSLTFNLGGISKSASANGKISVHSLDLTLGYQAKLNAPATNQNTLCQMIDFAAVAGTIECDSPSQIYTHLCSQQAGILKSNQEAMIALNLNNEAFLAILPTLAKEDFELVGRAAALAMPWWDDQDYKARRSLERRIEAYAPAWTEYFQTANEQSAYGLLKKKLHELGEEDLLARENAYREQKHGKQKRRGSSHKSLYFRGIIGLIDGGVISDVRKDYLSLVKGFRILDDARKEIDSNNYEKIESAFSEIESFFAYQFHFRMFSALLHLTLKTIPKEIRTKSVATETKLIGAKETILCC